MKILDEKLTSQLSNSVTFPLHQNKKFSNSDDEDFNLYTEELKDLKEDYITMRKKYEYELTKIKLEKEKLEQTLKVKGEKERNLHIHEEKIKSLEGELTKNKSEHKATVDKLIQDMVELELNNKELVEESELIKSKLKEYESEYGQINRNLNGNFII